MNISVFFMEPFNSPNKGNDILSRASTCKMGRKYPLFDQSIGLSWAAYRDPLMCWITLLWPEFEHVLIKDLHFNTPLLYSLHSLAFNFAQTSLRSLCILRIDLARSQASGGDLHRENELNGVINITLIYPRKDLISLACELLLTGFIGNTYCTAGNYKHKLD